MIPRKWKYVVIEEPNAGLPMPIVFPEPVPHSHVAKLGRNGKVLSAGFCEFDPHAATAKAYGESVGLGVKSNPPVDEQLLRMWFLGAY